MALREELLGQKYLAGSIQYWFMVSKTLLKSLEEFVDSFLFLKWIVCVEYNRFLRITQVSTLLSNSNSVPCCHQQSSRRKLMTIQFKMWKLFKIPRVFEIFKGFLRVPYSFLGFICFVDCRHQIGCSILFFPSKASIVLVEKCLR